jgi:hypothetical protein
MKKLLLLSSAMLLLGASMASAAAPGANLGWVNCATTSTSQNYNNTCLDNTLTRNLVTSFRVAAPVSDFVGVSVGIEYVIGAPATPAWFQFGSGGCREGAFAPINVGTLAGCTNTYAGANQAGGFVTDVLGPNRYLVRADWARDAAGPLTATTLYSALVMQINTTNSFDEGFGFCDGCAVPACFVLKTCEIYSLSQGLVGSLGTDIRNWATYQGGSFGAGCPGETPAKSATWGSVKALYR